jgi:hypothetical protein
LLPAAFSPVIASMAAATRLRLVSSIAACLAFSLTWASVSSSFSAFLPAAALAAWAFSIFFTFSTCAAAAASACVLSSRNLMVSSCMVRLYTIALIDDSHRAASSASMNSSTHFRRGIARPVIS